VPGGIRMPFVTLWLWPVLASISSYGSRPCYWRARSAWSQLTLVAHIIIAQGLHTQPCIHTLPGRGRAPQFRCWLTTEPACTPEGVVCLHSVQVHHFDPFCVSSATCWSHLAAYQRAIVQYFVLPTLAQLGVEFTCRYAACHMHRYMQFSTQIRADIRRNAHRCAMLGHGQANQLTNQLGISALAGASVPQQRHQYNVQTLPQGCAVVVQSKDHLRNIHWY